LLSKNGGIGLKKQLSAKALAISPSATLAIDAKFKAMKAQGLDVVGFGAGEPDFDTPAYIKEAAVAALQKGMTKYTPASGTMQLREAICEKLKCDNRLTYKPSQIVVSNGAKHSLYNTFVALCNPGDEVILPGPYWVSYYELIRLADATPIVIKTTEETHFKFTLPQLKAAISKKTKALVLNSPCNPTGMVYSEDELREIAKICVENEIYVISDEIYEKLIYDGKKHVSIASFGDDIKELTILINGMSKSYAMTGWRIGYSASGEQLAKIMGNVQSHATSNPNSIAQYASAVGLGAGEEEIDKMRAAFEGRRNYMVERINSIDGVSCLMPQGAFYVMMNMESFAGGKLYGRWIKNSDDFCELFLEKGKVALVPGTAFDAPHYVRWSYATSEENIKEGLDRLEKFLREEY
jgi:aspartate aminotransferase